MSQDESKPSRTWREIAEEASREQDPEKLQKLAEELARALEEQVFKDKAGLAAKVGRGDANQRIRFSVVSDQDTSAGPGEMSYESFVTRFSLSNKFSEYDFTSRKGA